MLGFAPKRSRILKASEHSDISSEQFDVEKLVDSISKSGYDMPADLTIDDRDMPLAANFVEFMVGREFLSYKPFANADRDRYQPFH